MIRNDALRKYIEPFSNIEKIYKNLYILGMQNKPIDEYLNSLAEKGYPIKELYIRNVDPNRNYDQIDCLFYPYENDIAMARHIRYHPPFLHSHQFYELIYQIEGTSRHTINNMAVNLKEGDIFIIPPGPIHSVEVFDDSIIINLLLKVNALDDVITTLLPQKSIISRFFTLSCEYKYTYNYLLFHTDDDEQVQNMLENIFLECIEFHEEDDYSLSLRKTMLIAVFNYLLRNHSSNMVVEKSEMSMGFVFYQIYDYLQKNYQTANLKDAAKHFNYSPEYFSKIIHKNIGKTFNDILIDMRLSAACRLLITTDMPIRDIAFEVGYKNPEHFTSVFKKHIGTTPSSYRNRKCFDSNIIVFNDSYCYRKPD
ncbi:MAG: AraC family transcriptional regulator [Clostridia bacterium]|jgi:AraC-like DNA-binding protein/mannose-6-phosphate isomerase-like protein (cupin superfamily)